MVSSVLRKAADAIRGTNKPTTVPGFLHPIDTGRVADELDLDRIAANAAVEPAIRRQHIAGWCGTTNRPADRKRVELAGRRANQQSARLCAAAGRLFH